MASLVSVTTILSRLLSSKRTYTGENGHLFSDAGRRMGKVSFWPYSLPLHLCFCLSWLMVDVQNGDGSQVVTVRIY
jgi:hypothetical protein